MTTGSTPRGPNPVLCITVIIIMITYSLFRKFTFNVMPLKLHYNDHATNHVTNHATKIALKLLCPVRIARCTNQCLIALCAIPKGRVFQPRSGPARSAIGHWLVQGRAQRDKALVSATLSLTVQMLHG
jgi:hypothetical protein